MQLTDVEDSGGSTVSQRRNASQRPREPSSGRPQLGDYYVYPIEQLTTIANNQTKQVGFLDADGVKASKGYEITFTASRRAMSRSPPQVRMRFSNSKAAGLGEQLPAAWCACTCAIRAASRSSSARTTSGIRAPAPTSRSRSATPSTSRVQPTLVQTTKVNKRNTEYQMSYLVRNARADAIVVTLRQDGLWRENEVRTESIKGRRTDADSFAWDVPVPANGETTLTFTLRQGW